MTSPTTVTGVDFVTVFVKDYPAALKFYGETLGLEHSVDYEKIPAGEFETGSLTLQIMDAAAVGRSSSPAATRSPSTSTTSTPRAPSSSPRASSSSPRRSTAASATWPSSPTPTATP